MSSSTVWQVCLVTMTPPPSLEIFREWIANREQESPVRFEDESQKPVRFGPPENAGWIAPLL